MVLTALEEEAVAIHLRLMATVGHVWGSSCVSLSFVSRGVFLSRLRAHDGRRRDHLLRNGHLEIHLLIRQTLQFRH